MRHDLPVPRSADDPWDIAFSLAGTEGEPLGIGFLREAPRKVRATVQAVLEAVAEGPPHRFSGALHWQAMHGDMGGIYEVRVKGPDKRLYRLFCLLERAAAGLDAPTLVVLTGMSKPNGTAFSDSEYGRVRRLRDEHAGQEPRRVHL